jgi:hypothetical protein
MSRKKSNRPEQLLVHTVRTRVSSPVFNRLNSYVGNSDCHSIGEVARRILSNEKITTLTRDTTLDKPVEELMLIRKELNALGTNINQITRRFHSDESSEWRLLQAKLAVEQYLIVGEKVNDLLRLITHITKAWLQK